MLDAGNLRLGGVHLDVGLNLADCYRDLDSLAADLQRRANGAAITFKPRVASAPGGSSSTGGSSAVGSPSAGLPTAALAGMATAAVSGIARALAPIEAKLEAIGREITHGLNGAVDQLKAIAKSARTSASFHRGSELAEHDLRRAERAEIDTALIRGHGQVLMGKRPFANLARRPGTLQNLPADVRYLAGVGFEQPAGLTALPSRPAKVATAAVGAAAPASAAADPISSAGTGLTRAAIELQKAAVALQRTADYARSAAPAAPAPGQASHAGGVPPVPFALAPEVLDEAIKEGALPAGIDDKTKTVFIKGTSRSRAHYRRPPKTAPPPGSVAGAIGPNGPAVGRRGNRSGKVDIKTFAKTAGLIAASPILILDKVQHAALANLEDVYHLLSQVGHVGSLALNRVGAAARYVERGLGNAMKSTRLLRSALALPVRLVAAPFTFGLRALGLWDHRVGAGTNSLRLLGRTARALTAPLTAPLHAASRAAGTLNSVLKGLASAAIGIGASMVVGMAVNGVKASADLRESINAVQTVFKGSSDAVTDFADEMARKFGLVKKDVLDASMYIGSTLKANGFGTKDAASMTNVLTQRAADIGSQRNVPVKEVMAAFDSAITGRSMEPISRMGVALNDDIIKARAVKDGLAANEQQVGRTARAQAVYNLILEQSADAQGDLANTATSTTNLMRDLAGRFTNAAAALGSKLEPAFQELLMLMQEVFVGSAKATAAVHDWVGGIISGVVEAIRFVRRMWENWDAGVELVGTLMLQLGENVMDVMAHIGDVVGTFLDWFGANWKTIIADALRITMGLFESYIDSMAGAFEQLQNLLTGKAVDWAKLNPFEVWKKTLDDLGKVEIKTPKMDLPELRFRNSFEKQLGDLWARITGTEVRMPNKEAQRLPGDQEGNPIEKDGKEKKEKKDKKDTAGALIGAREMLNMMQQGALERAKDSRNIEKLVKIGEEQVQEQKKANKMQPAARLGNN